MAKKLTYDECYNIAKKYTQKKDFITHDIRAYNYAYRHKWLQDYTWLKHIPKKEKLYQQCYEVAQKCKTLNEFKESYKELYDISVKYFFKLFVLILKSIDKNAVEKYNNCELKIQAKRGVLWYL